MAHQSPWQYHGASSGRAVIFKLAEYESHPRRIFFKYQCLLQSWLMK